MLGGVNYYSGQAFEFSRITDAGHAKGCVVGFDMAHAAGNLPLKLHDWNVDFAVWCSYKYLNAGPGAVGGCFVHERHARNFRLPRFAGWWGHNKAERFLYDPKFAPIAGAQGWQISNPPILSTAPLLASLEIFQRAGMRALRAKSIALTGFMQRLIEERLPKLIEIITPTPAEQRGCQLSVRLARPAVEARRCQEELTAAGVIGDWREPDVLRLAPIPLYNSFADVFAAVDILARALHG
jgi:kynureninase